METQIKTASFYIFDVWIDGYRCSVIDDELLKTEGFIKIFSKYIENFDAVRVKYEHPDGRNFSYIRSNDSQGNGSVYAESNY